ncbi:trypsin-like peptidase domain-containing protein [Mesorhizobium onobrychidis]|uniref:Serine protease n=1 Tax=Mesorhizobium onobrychidis TaxID=2775404 RepID=A0ABY5R7C5_9HYPH|nr:trypsin-like peptidase domain-containing protein [Mesorhizobium onobrychidis]UVC19415.1 trypsin-like peptidase domain-containing protein [Mesorhizobium onobrychidis]
MVDSAPGRAPRGIPFASATKPEQSFADIRAKLPVTSPESMQLGWKGVREVGVTFERAIGRYVTISATLLKVLADRRRAVARIQTDGIDFRGDPGAWGGTGFLVAPNLFLTNNHVLNSDVVAGKALVEFDYEVGEEALLGGTSTVSPSKKVFRLDPRRLFITSPAQDGLDYTFVWIDSSAAAEFGTIVLERSSFTMMEGEQAFVIHHPDGRLKEASVDDTDILKVDSRVVHYSSDTDYGSSGAPVFNRQGNLIALHHATSEQDLTLPNGHKSKYVNEGIKIAAIALDLETKAQSSGSDAATAQEVLSAIRGSDTLTGFFGALGRRPEGANDLERVVNAYTSDDADIDIGFWNIEHLASRYQEGPKLEAAAAVLADMKLDIWGLSEVSPNAVRALVKELKERFGEDYGCAFSEPDAGDGKQSTAVIWRTAVLDGSSVEWPEEVQLLFKMRSDNPAASEFEAVHGKIFDRYPGLFRFVTGKRYGAAPVTLHVIPLHLKAMSEGSLRRRMASGILRRALEVLKRNGIEDVILGGDMNATLASGDLNHLKHAGFRPMGADDEQDGAFTYLKSPYKSFIDNIFLSPNLKHTFGDDEFLVVARDREIGDFVKTVSDHRPIMIRLALRDKPATEEPAGTSLGAIDVDGLLDSIQLHASFARRPPAALGLPGKITFEELKRMLSDPSIPDARIRPYLQVSPRDHAPFSPIVEPNPNKVIMDQIDRVEVESAINWGNSFCRWRREQRFEQRLKINDPKPILLVEGDSWFQFPLLLDEVVDHLDGDFVVRCLGAAGDTADNMIHRDPEYARELAALDGRLGKEKRKVSAFLLSAAGNDVIGADAEGNSVLLKLLKKYQPKKGASAHIDPKASKAVFSYLEAAYRKVIATVHAMPTYRDLPILIHGYDYAIPGGFAEDPRHPIWAAQDKWLGAPMRAKGIVDPILQREIIKLLIDRLYDMFDKVAGNSRVTKVHMVDARGALGPVDSWADEIHGTSDGFANVASRFKAVLNRVIRL